MHLLVLGSILTGLYFWGQFHKNVPILLPAVLCAFTLSAALCALSRFFMEPADIPSTLGAFFVIGTAFYAVWCRFLRKDKKAQKRR